MFAGLSMVMLWNSCKKGPEDPFFSIHSRLGRVCGSWQVTFFEVDFYDSLRRVVDSAGSIGGCGDQIEKNIDFYDYEWTFDKHGNWSEKLTVKSEHTIDILNNTQPCPDVFEVDSFITVTLKNWNFSSNVGDFKNKEQLYLYDNETKLSTVYTIIECREKEMKLETETVDPETNTVSLRQYTLTTMD